ncbi:hypothetical protein HDU67_009401 [Dinochytrium kinnereticum]|nr:hypothetical protein HDU67_009401 [Dinochytrium kinnereticum]
MNGISGPGQPLAKPSEALISHVRKAIMLLCAGAEDYLHPGHKLSSKRVIFVDDHGHDNGPAKTTATIFAELKASWRDGIFGSSASLSSNNVPKDVMFLRGGVQLMLTKFPGLCIGVDGRALILPGGSSKYTASTERLNEQSSAQTQTEQDQPWVYSDSLAGLNDSVLDPAVADLLRKRMAIQMAVMSMITSPMPAEDLPRLVLYHVMDGVYNYGGKRSDDSQPTTIGLSPHPFLYIGSQESAKPKHLKSQCISHVIRLGNCRWPYPSCTGVTYHDLAIDDVPSARISSLFPTTTAILDGIRIRGERVLIHCQAGVSRSASIVLSFILRRGTKGSANANSHTNRSKNSIMQLPSLPDNNASQLAQVTSLRDAFQVLHSARPIVCPNPGFWAELEQYERVLNMATSNILPAGGGFTNPNAAQGQISSLPYFWMIQFHNVLDIEYRARVAMQRLAKTGQHL